MAVLRFERKEGRVNRLRPVLKIERILFALKTRNIKLSQMLDDSIKHRNEHG